MSHLNRTLPQESFCRQPIRCQLPHSTTLCRTSKSASWLKLFARVRLWLDSSLPSTLLTSLLPRLMLSSHAAPSGHGLSLHVISVILFMDLIWLCGEAVHEHVCTCSWRTEVRIGCLSQSCPTLLFEKESVTEPVVHRFSNTGQKASGSFVSASPGLE